MQQPDNFIELIISKAEHEPEHVAFSYLDNQCNVINQLSNQQLHSRAVAIANRIQQIASPTDRVLLLFPQGLEFIYAFVGVLYSGMIPVIAAPPKNTQHNNLQLHHIQKIIEETNSNIVLTSTLALNEVVQYFLESKALATKIILSVEDIDNDVSERILYPSIENNNLAYLQCTSTKGGESKLVMISHGAMNSTQDRIKKTYKLTSSSRSVSWLPHYHYLGLVFGILQPLYCGYRGYLYSPFDFYKNPLGWLDAITKYEVTFSGAPNFAYNMCIDQALDSHRPLNLSKWTTAYNSGEPVKRKTIDSFIKKFSHCGLQKTSLASIFGLAESTCVVSGNHQTNIPSVIFRKSMKYLSENFIEKNHSGDKSLDVIRYGSTVFDTQVAIVVPGTRIKSGNLEPGEILVRSTCNATGYWNKPEETEEIFNVYLEGSNDGPYLRTGDLGFMEKGEVHVVGRLKNDRQVSHSSVNISQNKLVNEKI